MRYSTTLSYFWLTLVYHYKLRMKRVKAKIFFIYSRYLNTEQNKFKLTWKVIYNKKLSPYFSIEPLSKWNRILTVCMSLSFHVPNLPEHGHWDARSLLTFLKIRDPTHGDFPFKNVSRFMYVTTRGEAFTYAWVWCLPFSLRINVLVVDADNSAIGFFFKYFQLFKLV